MTMTPSDTHIARSLYAGGRAPTYPLLQGSQGSPDGPRVLGRSQAAPDSPTIRLEREYAGLDTPSPQVTKQTVEAMCRHIRAALKDPLVHHTAAKITESCTSPMDAAAKIWLWLKVHVKFTQDAELIQKLFGERDHFELLISPSVLLRMKNPQGDCDCFTMLGLALLAACGFNVRIVTICCDHNDPSRYSHVCGEVYLPDQNRWRSFDASHGKQFGWEVPERDQYRRTAWNLQGSIVSDVQTLPNKKKARAA